MLSWIHGRIDLATHSLTIIPTTTNPQTGSGDDSLRHMRFSEEVKRTFLERWSQLPKPYVGFHVRSTDRSCSPEKFQAILKTQLQRLPKRKSWLEGAPVYLATDNPEWPEMFRRELEDVQGREIVSFTYHPTAAAADKGGDGDGGWEKEEGGKEGSHVEPLHLNTHLTPEEKHRTNVDGFVDLLLLAFSAHFIKTCGGYTRLAKFLHGEKATALGLIGETLSEGQDVNDVLAAAWRRIQAEEREWGSW